MNGTDMSSSSSQSKDPAFKLFGKNIPVPDTQIPSLPQSKIDCGKIGNAENGVLNEDKREESNESSALGREMKGNQASPQMNRAEVGLKPKEEQAESSSTDQEKVLKKPDKILPCPRCNSLETKFCYFNNYNVNQPRHFCKNCQRYWTAGGTMRNVPIGAGRRKNKHLASQYHQILVSSDGIPLTGVENTEPSSHVSSVDSQTVLSSSPGNGVVLKFGSDTPLCESMENVLNLGNQKKIAEIGSTHGKDKTEEPSLSGSLMSASSTKVNQLTENVTQKEQTGAPVSSNKSTTQNSLPYYPVPTWMVPWSPAWNNVASMAALQQQQQACAPNNQSSNQVQWCPTPMLAVPGFCPPNIPVQLVPATPWGCTPILTAATGNLLLVGSNGCQSPSSSTSTTSCSGNGSPTLGKHSRDMSVLDDGKAENGIVVPKTLRIDDPNEASKSPLWSALGLKSHQKDLISKGSVCKTFKTKAEADGHVSDASFILEANPAALSRSHTFQEHS